MEKVDAYGIENVNFSLISPSDERWDEYKAQRLERGFDDSELWSLDMTIAKFIYPRLKAFAEHCGSTPSTLKDEEWNIILDDMLKAFEIIINPEKFPWSDEDNKIIVKGLDLFRSYFFALWT